MRDNDREIERDTQIEDLRDRERHRERQRQRQRDREKKSGEWLETERA